MSVVLPAMRASLNSREIAVFGGHQHQQMAAVQRHRQQLGDRVGIEPVGLFDGERDRHRTERAQQRAQQVFFGATVERRVVGAFDVDDRREIGHQRDERPGIVVGQTLQPRDERVDVGGRPRQQLPHQRRGEFAQQFEAAAELIGGRS